MNDAVVVDETLWPILCLQQRAVQIPINCSSSACAIGCSSRSTRSSASTGASTRNNSTDRDCFASTTSRARGAARRGGQLPGIPEWMFSLSGAYSFPIGAAVEGFVGGGLMYQDERKTSFIGGAGNGVTIAPPNPNFQRGARETILWSRASLAISLAPHMLALNRLPSHGQPLAAEDVACFGAAGARQVEAWLKHCPAHAPTPLHSPPALAAHLRVARVLIKDEATRLRLGSFKALGGAYALLRVFLEHAERRLARTLTPDELLQPEVRALARDYTVACATDGNHGRSVAAGARMIGCRAVIYVHEHVAAGRAAAIAQLGAEVRRTPGTYDDSVAVVARDALAQGWTIVSDTAWPGYERIPLLVAQGYTVMAKEALAQIGATAPTHIFLQAGVGGLAAAVAAHARIVCAQRPRIVIVEPARAACIYASAEAGRRVAVRPGAPTSMSMLECYEPSFTAWRVLERVADAFMTVEEADAAAAVRLLANPFTRDRAIASTESGAAGFAGLLVAAGSESLRQMLGMNEDSSVLVFNTEGAAPGS